MGVNFDIACAQFILNAYHNFTFFVYMSIYCVLFARFMLFVLFSSELQVRGGGEAGVFLRVSFNNKN